MAVPSEARTPADRERGRGRPGGETNRGGWLKTPGALTSREALLWRGSPGGVASLPGRLGTHGVPAVVSRGLDSVRVGTRS